MTGGAGQGSAAGGAGSVVGGAGGATGAGGAVNVTGGLGGATSGAGGAAALIGGASATSSASNGGVVSVTGGGIAAPATVSVQPMVHQIDGAGNTTPHGVIAGLPVFRPQGGISAVIADPAVGDIGVAAFCMSDISAVKASGAPAQPGSFRRYDWADGIYFGGVLNAAATQYVLIDSSGVTVVSPSQVTVRAPTITLDGHVTTTGATSLGGGGAAVETVSGPSSNVSAAT